MYNFEYIVFIEGYLISKSFPVNSRNSFKVMKVINKVK